MTKNAPTDRKEAAPAQSETPIGSATRRQLYARIKAMENMLSALRAKQSFTASEARAVELLRCFVTLLLDTTVPIGPMRSRKDYPHELSEAVAYLATLQPATTTKEGG